MLQWSTSYFEERSVPSPRASIEWLLESLLDIRRLDLYLQYDRPLSAAELDILRPWILRRARHEPLQYITGETSFMGCTIQVTTDVLIPRQETEQLVERILHETEPLSHQAIRVLDIGTGSGCIPIALKKHRPAWHLYGADISDAALTVAKQNAALNQTEIQFFRADLFRPSDFTDHSWDLILSNPPYIPNQEMPTLEKQVRDYEPHLALFHEDPLLVADRIFEICSASRARLFMECNDQLSAAHCERAKSFGLTLRTAKDLDGRDRFLFSEALFSEGSG